MSRFSRLCVPVVLTLALAGCATPGNNTAAAQATAPTAITLTSCGQRLTFAQPPSRAVTLDQSATETLLALGLAGRMAGTAYLKTKVAPQYQAAYAKVPVLSKTMLTGEQLRAANPDLAIATSEALFTKDQVGTRDELRQLGLPTFASELFCPKNHPANLTAFDLLALDYQNLGQIFAVQDRTAKLIATQQAAVDAAIATRKSVVGTPSVVYLYSVFGGTPYVAGRGGIPSTISKLLGARNAFDDVNEQWPSVSWEAIAQRNPDFLVIGDLSERGAAGDSATDKLTMMRKDPAVSQLAALRANRIITVPGIEMDPSVRSVNTLRLVMDGMKRLGYVR